MSGRLVHQLRSQVKRSPNSTSTPGVCFSSRRLSDETDSTLEQLIIHSLGPPCPRKCDIPKSDELEGRKIHTSLGQVSSCALYRYLCTPYLIVSLSRITRYQHFHREASHRISNSEACECETLVGKGRIE